MVPGDPNELWHRLGGPSRHLGGHGCLEGGGGPVAGGGLWVLSGLHPPPPPRKNVEKRALLENMEGLFLAVDEIVDGGWVSCVPPTTGSVVPPGCPGALRGVVGGAGC